MASISNSKSREASLVFSMPNLLWDIENSQTIDTFIFKQLSDCNGETIPADIHKSVYEYRICKEKYHISSFYGL